MEEKNKNTFLSIVLKALIFLGYAAFIGLMVLACVGNFLNVDESPFPGLHWKP